MGALAEGGSVAVTIGVRDHNCIAIAERAVMTFVKEFQWDYRFGHSQTVSFTIPPKLILYLKQKIPVITEIQTQLFPIYQNIHDVSEKKL